MAELPEVETLRRQLERDVVGRKVKSVDVSDTKAIPRHATKKLFDAGHSSPVSVSRNSSRIFFCFEFSLVGVSTSTLATRSPRPRALSTLMPIPR